MQFLHKIGISLRREKGFKAYKILRSFFMKTKKKVLLALLSATCITAGAFGLAACGGGGDESDADIVNVYNQYVAYAESNGDTPLSYEAWLATIKGQQGEPGTPGAPGAAGKSAYELYKEDFLKNNPDGIPMTENAWVASLTGKDGKGIKSIELNADQTKLVITYTDDTSEEVDLPDALVHKHDYGNDYVTVIAPNETADGLGYLTCEDCGHKELFVIAPYKVSVYLADGKTPAEGATVSINGTDVTTDSNGLAVFSSLKLGEYDVSVTKADYAYVESVKTSLTQSEYKIVLAKEIDTSSWFGAELTPGSEVGDKKLFHLTANYTTDYYSNGWTLCDAFIEGSSDDYSKFKLTFNEEYGDLVYYDANYAMLGRADLEQDGAIEFVAAPGESINFKITVAEECKAVNGNNYDYYFTVERITPPAPGEKDAPITANLEEQVTYTATADEEVYFKISTENKTYGFELGEGVTLTALGSDKNSEGTLISSESQTVKGNYGYYFIKVKAADGNVSFKMKRVYLPGEQGNPHALTLGASNTAEINILEGISEVWYSYTVNDSTAGKYTIDVTDGYYNFDVYKGDDPLTATPVESDLTLRKYIIDLTAGNYYIVMKSECTFKLAEYDAATDNGYAKEYPLTVTDSNSPLTLELTTDMYFKYEVTKDGVFAMSAPKGNNSFGSNFAVYSDADYSTLLFNYYSDNLYCEVKAGAVIYFTANATGSTEIAHTVSFGVFEATTAVANPLIIKDDDGNLLSGVNVTVNGETKTTDANGQVIFELEPADNYTVALDFGENAENYVYSAVTLTKNYTAQPVEIIAKLKHEYSFNVKLGSEAAGAGITVKYGNYSAVTNESGVAGIKMPNPEDYGTYSVSVSNIPEDYEFKSKVYIDEGQYTYDIILTKKPVKVDLTGGTATLNVKAGDTYSITTSTGFITVTTSTGYIATFDVAGYGKLVNGTNIMMVQAEKDGEGYATSVTFDMGWGGETATVSFSADATVTITTKQPN